MKSANSLIQYFLLALVVIFYAINGFVFAAFYGAAISLNNTLIFNWYTDKQEALVDADAQKSFRMAINSRILMNVLRNKLSLTRSLAESELFSTTMAVSYLKPATTANTPASFINVSTVPKSSGSYSLPRAASAAKPMS